MRIPARYHCHTQPKNVGRLPFLLLIFFCGSFFVFGGTLPVNRVNNDVPESLRLAVQWAAHRDLIVLHKSQVATISAKPKFILKSRAVDGKGRKLKGRFAPLVT